jgi:aromatic ring-cleaving dioxygenase
MVVLRDFTPCSKVYSDVSEEPTASVFREKIGVNIHQKEIQLPRRWKQCVSPKHRKKIFLRGS